MLLVVGHVPTATKGREAFQEIDYHAMFGGVAKAVLEPESSPDVAQTTARALALATSGRPGPVVLVMPKDITEGDAGDVAIPRPIPRAVSAPAPQAVASAARLIDMAERPMVIAGEMVTNEGAQSALVRFAEASGAAVSTAYRRQDAFPNGHTAYAGHLEINRVAFQEKAFAEADLIIAVGARMDGITSQEFSLVRPDQAFIHVFPDPDVLARLPHTLALAADTGPTMPRARRRGGGARGGAGSHGGTPSTPPSSRSPNRARSRSRARSTSPSASPKRSASSPTTP